MFAVFVAVFVAIVAHAKNYKIVFENKGFEGGLGVYFMGNRLDPTFIPGSESFREYLAVNDRAAQAATYGDRFIIRDAGVSPSFRCGVEVRTGGVAESGEKYPYEIVFHALGIDAGAGPIELKHQGVNSEEFVWIEPGNYLPHYTTANSEFVVRSKESIDILGVTVFPLDKEEV